MELTSGRLDYILKKWKKIGKPQLVFGSDLISFLEKLKIAIPNFMAANEVAARKPESLFLSFSSLSGTHGFQSDVPKFVPP